MRKILTVLLFILVLIGVSYGAKAVDGYVALDYNLMHKGGHIGQRGGQGELYVYEEVFNDKVRIGGRMTTDLMAFNLKGNVMPSGVPSSQTYDLEISYKVTDDLTITFIEGCKHYFSQSGYSEYNGVDYMKVRTKYEF